MFQKKKRNNKLLKLFLKENNRYFIGQNGHHGHSVVKIVKNFVLVHVIHHDQQVVGNYVAVVIWIQGTVLKEKIIVQQQYSDRHQLILVIA